MSRPSVREIKMLIDVADEIRTSAEESGYSVDAALVQHKSFRNTRWPASNLERELLLDAARRGAAATGMGVEEVPGGGVEIVTHEDGRSRRYRLKRVSLDANGQLVVICGKGSSLIVSDPDTLFPEERWVFGFVTTADHAVARLVVAEIVDWTGNGPIHLKFGTVINLADNTPPRGFTSTEEDLPGFEDDGDEQAGAA